MPLKLRRTLSMEDLQNASDDEMDGLLSPQTLSPRNEGSLTMQETPSSSSSVPSSSSNNGTSQRERIFPFSLIADDSTSRPRPKPGAHPIIVPVTDTIDDFFLHGPQAPILKVEGSSTSAAGDSSTDGGGPGAGGGGGSKINGKTSSSHTYQSIPRSKSVRFEEPDDDDAEYNGRRKDHRLNGVQTQVNQVTQKMKDNISRLLEREASLDSLADLTDQLHHSGDIFRQSTEHLRRKLWWRQQKTRLVLTAVFIFCTVLLFVPLISRLLR